MNDKLNKIWALLKDQLTESSTIRGVLVLASLAGGKLEHLPIDATLSIAVVLGAILKILLPDKISWGK